MNQVSIIKEEFKKRAIAREVNCFECKKDFTIKFVNSSKDYSKKNNWGYWTEQEEYSDKHICSDCLKRLYYEDFHNFRKKMTDKKRRVFRTYLALKIL